MIGSNTQHWNYSRIEKLVMRLLLHLLKWGRYIHESLTFNGAVACEVISKWKDGLKEEKDARSYVCLLNSGCRKSINDNDDY